MVASNVLNGARPALVFLRSKGNVNFIVNQRTLFRGHSSNFGIFTAGARVTYVAFCMFSGNSEPPVPVTSSDVRFITPHVILNCPFLLNSDLIMFGFSQKYVTSGLSFFWDHTIQYFVLLFYS